MLVFKHTIIWMIRVRADLTWIFQKRYLVRLVSLERVVTKLAIAINKDNQHESESKCS